MDLEPEEITRLIDGVYKNIIEKFNPCARNLISAGKAYLKALQAVNTASSVFNDCLSKIASNAQQSPSNDIGDALINVVNQFNAIQDQHINILKAFYVDLLMPLENNLEKDTKIVQVEQKKYLQQHKNNLDSFCKAVTTLKKQRKKKSSSGNTNKELKSLQQVEEQKNKLRNFCNQSLKHALTQERRRYGFVLERQCSIAKHWLSYHDTGKSSLENNIEDWLNIATTREQFNMEEFFKKKQKKSSENDMDSNILRKTRSMDVTSGDPKGTNDNSYTQSLPRTKSEHNLSSSKNESNEHLTILRSIYSYEANGRNQLNFEEGDRIILIDDRGNGWQFGENLRTKELGWYPSTYTEKETETNSRKNIIDDTPRSTLKRSVPSANRDNRNHDSRNHEMRNHKSRNHDSRNHDSRNHDGRNHELSPSRMFGDTLMFRNTKYFQRVSPSDLSNFDRTSPPQGLPPPIPTGYSGNEVNSSQNFNINSDYMEPRRSGLLKTPSHKNIETDHGYRKSIAPGPPPQPEIDYSDEEREKSNRMHLKHDSTNESNTSTLKKSSSFESMNSNSNNMDSINNNKVVDLNTINRKGNFIKRTKSFWKAKKHEDSLDEKSLWKHKDLMQQQNKKRQSVTSQEELSSREEQTLRRNNHKNGLKLTNNYYVNARQSAPPTQNSTETPKKHNGGLLNNNSNKTNSNNNSNLSNGNHYDSGKSTMQTALMNYDKEQYFDSDSDLTIKFNEQNSFDEDSRLGGIKKTLKRREILKQYYSSDDGSETESQDYDCIVINDHLVNKTKMEFKTFQGGGKTTTVPATTGGMSSKSDSATNLNNLNNAATSGTLLPRTKLLNKSHAKKINNENKVSRRAANDTNDKLDDGNQQKTYGPWYDLWDPNEATNKEIKNNSYH